MRIFDKGFDPFVGSLRPQRPQVLRKRARPLLRGPRPGSKQLVQSGIPSRASEKRPGLLQLIAREWEPEALREALLGDLDKGFRLLRSLPPAVTFFGGARIKRDDPFFELGKEIGRQMANAGVPPRTGAGPGIMEAVPEGYKDRIDQLDHGDQLADHVRVNVAAREWLPRDFAPVREGVSPFVRHGNHRTQGFNIKLPHEQKISPSIDLNEEMLTFVYRKLMLYENVRGMVTFPGGYGTMDELFEVWHLAAAGGHEDPLVAVGKSFWGPLLGAVGQSAVHNRKLITPEQWSLMKQADTADEVMTHLAAPRHVRGFESSPDELAKRLASEITSAISTLDKLPNAVTVVGAASLQQNDPTLAAVQKASELMSRSGASLKVGGGDTLMRAVAAGSQRGNPRQRVQAFLTNDDQSGRGVPGIDVHSRVQEYTTHKELLQRKTDGLIALPGDLQTLDQVFTVLCAVQCDKMPKIPIVLVGKDYWQPIMDAVRETMLSGERKTISPEDMDLFTITDDPKEIAGVIQQYRNRKAA